MRKRLLGGILLTVLAIGLAACGDDDGGSTTATTAGATTASPAFCKALVDFKTLSNSTQGVDTPEQVAQRGKDVATAARLVASTAPESVRTAATELVTGAEDLELATAVNSTSPPAVLDKANKDLQASLKTLDAYAAKNCPGSGG